jgi:integrase
MGRRATGPRWYETKNYWAFTHKGTKHVLAHAASKDDMEAAQKANMEYHRIMLNDSVGKEEDNTKIGTVLDCCLHWVKQNRKWRTIYNYNYYFQLFHEHCGSSAVKELKPIHVEQFLDKKPEWSQSTKATFLIVIIRAFNWAVKRGIISKNPIAGMERPSIKSRGLEVLITPQEHETLMKAMNPAARDFFTAIYESGARPGEISSLEAKHFDAQLNAFVLTDHKMASKGRHRFIYCSPTMLALVKRLMEKHPTGPIFRNTWGRPWTKSSYCPYLRRLTKRLGMRRIIAYGWRHTFAMNYLRSGKSVVNVVEAMGHKDTQMILHHYGHTECLAPEIAADLTIFRPVRLSE